MNEALRFEAWKQQTEEIYRGLGEFVVKFETVCFSISLCIQAMLERSGLRSQKISQVLLAGLTAEPLRTLFESLAAETNLLSEEERAGLKSLLTRFQRLTTERNDIVHGIKKGPGSNCFLTTMYEKIARLLLVRPREEATPRICIGY